ncbi:imm11 family protein [Loktanella sp. S4079]|uniref:imm11 family protein n=1 Tax=Loktanella sp. S4079 TaxID=579483 RepID=UPI0005F9B146|nr:DUF1629 domain-containing protein [Loktanella sp. S4079]KJZ20361.1 hypothetical protein TW80_06030 [Loktanella sp. S4079]
MTWGIYETTSFGSYLPDGEYVGYDEGLKHYYYEVMSDADKEPFEKSGGRHITYSRYVTKKFVEDTGYMQDGLPLAGPVLDHEAPKEFRLVKKPSKGLSAMMQLGYRAVSEELKTAIEALDPGVHDFWPVRITLPKGEEWPELYYTIRIGCYLESFRPEESDDGSWRTRNQKSYYVDMPNKKCFSGLAMSQSVIGSSHLWKERSLRRPEFCMSDEMAAAFKKAGFTGSKLYKLKDVS